MAINWKTVAKHYRAKYLLQLQANRGIMETHSEILRLVGKPFARRLVDLETLVEELRRGGHNPGG